MKKILILFIFMCLSRICSADETLSLTLTESEKQKLKYYFPSEDRTELLWKGDPITVYLPIGKEKRVVFENHVSVDLKGALNTDQIKIINNDKSIYLTALQSFQKTRIYVTDQSTNKVILIDLTVNELANAETKHIILQKINHQNIANTTTQTTIDQLDSNEYEVKNSTLSYVDLIRFAWKQTYSPEKFINKLPSSNRVPMKTHRFVANLVYGDKVIAHPASSWMLGGNYVTVIFLQNKYHHVSSINLRRDICGDFLAGTLYPRSTLKAYKNKGEDSTTLFLVSRKTFGEAIRMCYGNA